MIEYYELSQKIQGSASCHFSIHVNHEANECVECRLVAKDNIVCEIFGVKFFFDSIEQASSVFFKLNNLVRALAENPDEYVQ